MTSIFISIVISLFILIVTTLVFYEVLSLIMKLIVYWIDRPRVLLVIMIFGLFIAHGISISIYGIACWFLTKFSHFPPLEGVDADTFGAYLYYSATNYSSLGIGDVFPRGCLRIITSFEVINGLTLIAWSATFTYFSVDRMWRYHKKIRKIEE